jgi:hypothetical protein
VLHGQQGLDAAPRQQLPARITTGPRPEQDHLGRQRRARPGGERGQVRQGERGARR